MAIPPVPTVVGKLKSSDKIKRHAANPVLEYKDIPYPAGLIFNAGVCKYQGRYVMVFRNDVADMEARKLTGDTNIGLAYSDDGINWEVTDKPCFAMCDEENIRAYDPRITVIEGKICMCFALDTEHGLRGGIAVTEDFENWDIKSLSVPDNRNMVLFPEKFDGKYVRLERPFPVYSRFGVDRFDMWMSDSPDLAYWGNSRLVLGVEHLPFCNNKIGPAAPPVKTPKGWLTAIHSVDLNPDADYYAWHPEPWKKRYCAGIVLLDLEDPSKVIGMSKEPLMAPEASYEVDDGYRTEVIFPGGMILEDDGEVKIYYGAADTVECLATAHIDDLLALCTEKP
jgi:beta-1,4-mannooligosaccharide/beta-1,4-mannosyl-N-acetylglucosamine phosphorylase